MREENRIAREASLLGEGSNLEIFNNIKKLESFEEKVFSALNTSGQDWALRTVLDIFPNTHNAAVAFLKSSQKGQIIYREMSSFLKKCFMNMQLTNDNINIYRALLSLYYSEQTTITMLPARKSDFYRHEFDECKEDYEKIDSLDNRLEKKRIAYRMLEIVTRIEGVDISKHMVTLKIDNISKEDDMNKKLDLPPGYEHFSRFFPLFLKDHPNPKRNVFLMMRFKDGKQYDEIHAAIRNELKQHELFVLRADEKDYTGDLWENVCLYMLGSSYGVAVFEEIDLKEFNPSVALELGFMLALNKRCLILKDKRMARMPTDIVGKLYKEFDTYEIEKTLKVAIKSWVRDLALHNRRPRNV